MIFLRNHDEFKDELLRRKSEFDQRRHRRARVLTQGVCAALCLCLVLSFLLPGAVSPDTPTEPIIDNPTLSTSPSHATAPSDPTGIRLDNTQTVNLLSGVIPKDTQCRPTDEAFTAAQMDFALKLLQGSYDGENTLVSPLSAALALSMLANGAGGETLAQIEDVLFGGIPVDDWNEYLKYYVNLLPTTDKVKLHQANSIWYSESPSLSLRPSFLQTVTDYYNSELYAAPFNDATKNEINDWISRNTDGLIENALNELDGVMCLINALVFDGNWETPYNESNIFDRPFHNADGGTEIVDMMIRYENLYLESDTARGFMKAYDGGNYAFVAILPNEDLTLTEYLESLTVEDLTELLNSPRHAKIQAGLPQFEYEYALNLDKILQDLGMTDAFDPTRADFSSMADDLYVSSVLQKTRIIVDAKGTKAAATTIVTMAPTSAPAPDSIKPVILDRPFLYMIVDTHTNLPIFLGTITDLGG